MPTPSGLFSYVSNVSDASFEAASEALDRALLKVVGLPEELEIRELENALYDMTEKIKALVSGFTVSKLIAILPGLVMDGAALWDRVESKLSGEVERKEFITAVVRYAYRKNDPDLPVLVEPFETMVENMIINAIPDLLDNLEEKLNELSEKLKKIFG
jgi:hypothetical protein